MPPSNFFSSLGNTNFLRTHGTSPRSSLNLADDTKVPGGVAEAQQRKRNVTGRYLCALFFTFRWKNFELEWRS
jgi:hypothetical protein